MLVNQIMPAPQNMFEEMNSKHLVTTRLSNHFTMAVKYDPTGQCFPKKMDGKKTASLVKWPAQGLVTVIHLSTNFRVTLCTKRSQMTSATYNIVGY